MSFAPHLVCLECNLLIEVLDCPDAICPHLDFQGSHCVFLLYASIINKDGSYLLPASRHHNVAMWCLLLSLLETDGCCVTVLADIAAITVLLQDDVGRRDCNFNALDSSTLYIEREQLVFSIVFYEVIRSPCD